MLYASLSFAQSRSQPDKFVSFASPNAMSLGVFGEFPPAMPTGVPNISVPVYTIKYRGLEIPLALSYNANLVKPDVHPGWVGLGWNLSLGGSITRVINDKPDDANIFDGNVNQRLRQGNIPASKVGYYYQGAFLKNDDWMSAAKIQAATTDYKQFSETNNGGFFSIPSSIFDYQPDEFAFNFLGYSGTFYLDPTRHWKVRCDQRIKVDITGTSDFLKFEGDWDSRMDAGGFGKFIITDDKGIRYIFGGNTSAIEYSANLFPMESPPLYPKSWNLTKIVLPNNEEITFSYQRGSIIIQPIIDKYTSPDETPYFNTLVGSSIYPSYLVAINTPVEKISFNRSISEELGYRPQSFDADYSHFQHPLWDATFYGNLANQFVNTLFMQGLYKQEVAGSTLKPINFYKLDKILVTDKILNRPSRAFKFTYNNNNQERLKLKFFAAVSPFGEEINQQFEFTYNDQIPFPNYLTDQTDFWGYYNGRTPDYSTEDTRILSKKPDAAMLQAQVLQKIIYPTKGYTTYQFEPHKFSKKLDFNRSAPLIDVQPEVIAGGLRIAEIRNYDQQGQTTDWRKYSYVNNYSPGGTNLVTSGILGSVYIDPYASGGLEKKSGDTFLTPLIPSANNNNGSHIGYSEVTEIFSDGGYRNNRFSNFDNGNLGEYMDEQPQTILHPTHDNLGSPLYPSNIRNFVSKSFLRGKLLRELVFNSDNQLLSEKNIKYTGLNKDIEFVRNITTEFGRYIENHAVQIESAGTAFKTYTYAYLPSEETTTTFSSGSAVGITKALQHTYDPENRTLLTSSLKNSMGEIEEIINSYPQDMVKQGRDQDGIINGTYGRMASANDISSVIETVKKIGGKTMEVRKTEYANVTEGLIKPFKEQVSFNGNPLKTLTNFADYDDDGNLLRYSSPNGAPTSFIYGYNNTLPIAKVSNGFNSKLISSKVNISLPFNSSQPVSTNFNVWYALGTSKVALRYDFTVMDKSVVKVYCKLSGPGGFTRDFILAQSGDGSLYDQPNFASFKDLPVGNYTLTAQWFSKANLTTNMTVDVNYAYSSTSSVYCENFEENGTIGVAHTGYKYHPGAFDVKVTPYQTGTFFIDFFYRIGGQWRYRREEYTGPRQLLPAGADAIDDVRIYPSDSQIISYTYTPSAGISSQIDSKGYTLKYVYDDFQRLYQIIDDEGNIIKQFCYNYSGQLTNCAGITVTSLQSSVTTAPRMYVRAEILNIGYVNTSTGPEQTVDNYEIYGDVFIRFYLNPDCTIPYTLAADIQVDLEQQYTYANYYGSNNYPSVVPYLATSGSYEVNLGRLLLKSNSAYTDNNGNYSFDSSLLQFNVIGHSGSNYEPVYTIGNYY